MKEDLWCLFPGKLNQAQAVERKALAMKYLDIVSKLPRGHARTAELGMLRETFPAPIVARDDDNNGTIRFDMKFPMVTPLDDPREVWFDHVIVQETCPTYASATWRFLEEGKTNLPENGPAFLKAKGMKALRYSALIFVVNRLVEDRKLNFQPTFLFPVLSSLGIMNADMKQLMKLIVQRFKDNQRHQPPSSDGIAANVLKGRFKVQLRNAVCFALIRGNALCMSNQGMDGGVRTPP
jgi:hypothetical protein